MEEIFKDIPNFEGYYQVSNLGNVKSLSRQVWGGRAYYTINDRMLKKTKDSHNYRVVKISAKEIKKSFRVHQLVAIAFLNHTPNGTKGLIVDHIDNNRNNNNLSNLQLVTYRENNSKDRVGTSKYTGVCWNKAANKYRCTININGKSKHLGYFTDEYEAHLVYQNELRQL